MSRVITALILATLAAPLFGADAIVIAHRGASGYLPEHTLAGYELAIDQGADFIEPDLVITRDGELVARHDVYLSSTTDVASLKRFSDRRRMVDARSDWFAWDFTLAEIKTLRAKQAFPDRPSGSDGLYEIPTFQEVIDLVRRKQEETGRVIGIYPETKAPGKYASLGFDFASLLVGALARNGMNDQHAAVFVQSFEPEILKQLRQVTTVRLVMLVQPVSRDQPSVPNIPLEEIAQFADGVGAFKVLLMDAGLRSSGFIEAAHGYGLVVHAWTFRDDSYPIDQFDSAASEIEHYLRLGIDGLFTDFPDTGVSVRNALLLADPRQ